MAGNTRTQRKIITAHNAIVTPDTPKIDYGPECLERRDKPAWRRR
jgi:hypothetical protein